MLIQMYFNFNKPVVVIVSSPGTDLMLASSIICFTYSNLCLSFLLRPSTVPSRIVPACPSCLSVLSICRGVSLYTSV